MDIKKYIKNPRITDYSFELADYIFDNSKILDKKILLDLYNYNLSLCQGTTALYPMSNWQSHRLCLMSAIANVLNNNNLIQQCEKLAINWLSISDCKCCIAKSQDFHWRDSCEYVIYGYWALVQAFVYLQLKTKKPYKYLFNNYFKWLIPYQAGTKKHIEFKNSKNMPADLSKSNYNKLFNPNYNNNFMKVYNLLKQ
jgi:hypothetical protein